MSLNHYFDDEAVGVDNNTSNKYTNGDTQRGLTGVDSLIRHNAAEEDMLEHNYLGKLEIVKPITDATTEGFEPIVPVHQTIIKDCVRIVFGYEILVENAY